MKNLILISLLCMFTGCMSFSDRPLRPVARSISQQIPEIRLEKEFAVSIGGGMFKFLDVITLNEADLSAMDHVQLAVYKVSKKGRNTEIDFSGLNFEQTLLEKDSSLHWDTIIRVRDEGEQVWVLVGMDLKKLSLEAVVVFVLDQDQLVLINVDGDLDRMLEFAMEPAKGHRHRHHEQREHRHI